MLCRTLVGVEQRLFIKLLQSLLDHVDLFGQK